MSSRASSAGSPGASTTGLSAGIAGTESPAAVSTRAASEPASKPARYLRRTAAAHLAAPVGAASAIFAGIEAIRAAINAVGASWLAPALALSVENVKICALGTIKEAITMMASRLSPLRRIEAKRLITHLFTHEQFDADRFAELLAGVMIDTPDVVTVAARALEAWNLAGSPDTNDLKFSSTRSEESIYKEIAEVVLDAAAVYRGETTEDPNDCHPLNDYHTRSRLSQAAAHLRAVADGKTDRKRSETHASRLEEILKSLGNVEGATDDREA